MNRYNIDVLKMQIRCSLDDVKKDQQTEIKRQINLSTDQKLDQQVKSWSNRSTDPELDQRINKSKAKLTD